MSHKINQLNKPNDNLVFTGDGKFNVYRTAYKQYFTTLVLSGLLWFCLAMLYFQYSAKFFYLAILICGSGVPIAKSINDKYKVSQHYLDLSEAQKKRLRFLSFYCAVVSGVGIAALPIGVVNWVVLSF